MRAMFSYGLALIFVIVAAAWLSTGTFVQGGRGPGEGEQAILTIIEGEDGPVSNALDNSGLLVEHHELEGEFDPHLTIAQRNEMNSEESAGARSVRIMHSSVQMMEIEVPLRGRTRAKASVSAVAETAGIVETVHVTKGQTVATGDLLCTLDQGTREAAVAQAESALVQAEAGVTQAQADYDTNAELRSSGIAAANTARSLEVALRAAQSSVAAAQSGLDNARAELERTEVRANSAGIVQDPLATVGSMLSMGGVCATLVQLDPMLFIGAVPESRIGLARLGLEATITTITGQTVEGHVTYIASTADPATRSFPVEIEIPNPDGSLRDGVTAEAIVNLGNAPAHLLPQSVLTLDDEGVLGVRTVEDGKVAFYTVTILRDTRDGVWVTGLPPQADVITVGQESVVPGQAVTASTAEDAAPEASPEQEESSSEHEEALS
jgi:membrane fusion protein, multidrug efflux system